MRKVYELEDLDCANCAAKMESAIKKIEGIEFANVNFMTQKIIIEATEEKFDSIMKEIIKVCKKVEPDCHICM